MRALGNPQSDSDTKMSREAIKLQELHILDEANRDTSRTFETLSR